MSTSIIGLRFLAFITHSESSAFLSSLVPALVSRLVFALVSCPTSGYIFRPIPITIFYLGSPNLSLFCIISVPISHLEFLAFLSSCFMLIVRSSSL